MQQRTFLLTVDIHCLLAHISESGYCPTTNSNYMVPSEKLMSNRFQGLYFTSKLCIHCPRASWDFSAFFSQRRGSFLSLPDLMGVVEKASLWEKSNKTEAPMKPLQEEYIISSKIQNL